MIETGLILYGGVSASLYLRYLYLTAFKTISSSEFCAGAKHMGTLYLAALIWPITTFFSLVEGNVRDVWELE